MFPNVDSATGNSKRSFVEISKDNDIEYVLPDRTNLHESAHTYACYDFEGAA